MESASELSDKEGWSQEEFQKKHFNEKIDHIESFGLKIIPDSLMTVRDKIYGALSKGVHVNSDNECIKLFPVMKQVIEELLSHRLERQEKENRSKQMKKTLEMVK